MKQLAKYLPLSLLVLTLSACNLNIDIGGVHGDGNVQAESRATPKTFTEIKAANGLDVFITQDDSYSVRVEADENLLELIRTEVEGSTLHIYTEKNIRVSTSKKVYVSLPVIEKIMASSGADIVTENGSLSVKDIGVKASSGSSIKLDVDANEIHSDCSSGADILLRGTAKTLYAEASSGSDIEAKELETESCEVRVSSGADVAVNTKKSLTAKASSGGSVKYKGNPEVVSQEKSSGDP